MHQDSRASIYGIGLVTYFIPPRWFNVETGIYPFLTSLLLPFQLTILNEAGRIWTMVAGGGASVIFADTIVEKGGVSELANYGEYSGAPNEGQVSKDIITYLCA